MAEIEVNEYVRTKNGSIDKVINPNYYMSIYVECEKGMYLLDNVVKHSKQLIDLIEVGDYVNGYRVIMSLKESKKHYNSKDDFVTCRNYTFEENEIKTILTKEIYMANCYKVGGEDGI